MPLAFQGRRSFEACCLSAYHLHVAILGLAFCVEPYPSSASEVRAPGCKFDGGLGQEPGVVTQSLADEVLGVVAMEPLAAPPADR